MPAMVDDVIRQGVDSRPDDASKPRKSVSMLLGVDRHVGAPVGPTRKSSLFGKLKRNKDEMAAPAKNTEAPAAHSALVTPAPAPASKAMKKFPDSYRIHCFRTTNHVSNDIRMFLWFFFVQKATYVVPRESYKENETNIKRIANDAFMFVSVGSNDASGGGSPI